MQRQKTTTIVVHHSVTPQEWDSAKTMANIKGSHDGTSPYHRVIGYNWQWSDPNQLEVKFHAGNYPVNLESIAVCMSGDFTKNDLKDYQKKQLTATLKTWMQQYGVKRANIKLHREVRLSPTACPGKIDQALISILLEESMTCPEELIQAQLEIVQLNTELGRVTAERDLARTQLAQEKSDHAETIKQKDQNYQNWQIELDRRKAAESKLAKIRGIVG